MPMGGGMGVVNGFAAPQGVLTGGLPMHSFHDGGEEIRAVDDMPSGADESGSGSEFTDDDDDDPELAGRGVARDHSFLRMRLDSDDLSYEEDRSEVMELDYTPCINRRPVDMHNPLRVLRSGRRIKCFICITIYTEGGDEMETTLTGVAENLDGWKEMGVGWEEVCVVFVCDGREKLNPSMKEYFTKLRIWEDEMLLRTHKNQEVTCHLFEKTVQLPRHRSQREYYQPLQLIVACKEKNGGKLNSHLWFMSAFARQLQPDYLFLIDVGTQPQPNALPMLYEAMEENPQVGGVCGEILARDASYISFVEASQVFEYKVQHVLDKAMESVFGYIAVLPGAFSGYRWRAIRGEPLNQYFLLEEASKSELGPFVANMYLAEDRVLCFEIVAKRNQSWTLHYVSSSKATTDIPTDLTTLIKQRRRWLNGSFFSLVYYISRFGNLLRRSDHGLCRRMALTVQFFWYVINLLVAWFGVGSLFLSFVVIFHNAFVQAGNEAGGIILYLFEAGYFILVMVQLVLGLGTDVNNASDLYFTSALIFGVLVYTGMLLAIWHVWKGVLSIFILFAAAGTFIAYWGAALLHGDLLVIVGTMPQYFFMIGTFVNILTIYSFCRMHDISWGIKEGSLRNQDALPKRKAIEGVDQKLFSKEQIEAQKGSEQVQVHLDANGNHADPAAAVTAAAAAAAGGDGADSVNSAPPPAGLDGPPGPESKQADAASVSSSVEEARAAAEEAEEEAKAAAVVEEKAREEEEKRFAKEEAKARRRRDDEQKQMEKDFKEFRSRLLLTWIASNWIYITTIIHFGVLLQFSIALAYIIFWSLFFRVVGSVVYQLERVIKACWAKCCWWCCIKCCWERHRMARGDRLKLQMLGAGERAHNQGALADDAPDYISYVTEERMEAERWGPMEWAAHYGGQVDDDEDPGNLDVAANNVFSPEAMGGMFMPPMMPVAGMVAPPVEETRDAGMVDLTPGLQQGAAAAASVLAKTGEDGKDAGMVDLTPGLQQGAAAAASVLAKTGEDGKDSGMIDLTAGVNEGDKVARGILAKEYGDDGPGQPAAGSGSGDGSSVPELEGQIDLTSAMADGQQVAQDILDKHDSARDLVGAPPVGIPVDSSPDDATQATDGQIDLTSALQQGHGVAAGIIAKGEAAPDEIVRAVVRGSEGEAASGAGGDDSDSADGRSGTDVPGPMPHPVPGQPPGVIPSPRRRVRATVRVTNNGSFDSATSKVDSPAQPPSRSPPRRQGRPTQRRGAPRTAEEASSSSDGMMSLQLPSNAPNDVTKGALWTGDVLSPPMHSAPRMDASPATNFPSAMSSASDVHQLQDVDEEMRGFGSGKRRAGGTGGRR